MLGLGIDPSLKGTGLAVVEFGVQDRVLWTGDFFLPTAKEVAEQWIAKNVYRFIDHWFPQVEFVGIEQPVASFNAFTLIRQARMVGALYAFIPEVFWSKIIPIAPIQTKVALGLEKGSKKNEVVEAVCQRYGRSWVSAESSKLQVQSHADAIGVFCAARMLWR